MAHNMTTEVLFAKTNPNAKIPSKSEENAGLDIYACFEENFKIIMPHMTKLIPTGLASACTTDYYFQLEERGSTGTKTIEQRCGVIDSGYRNEWFVPITNGNASKAIVIAKKEFASQFSEEDFIVYPYEKAICQAVIIPVPKVKTTEIAYEDLLAIKSERGLGCLGSSNK